MDAHRFDTIAKRLGNGATTRRGALRLLTGGLLAAGISRLGLEEAAAGCVHLGKKCGKGDKCCGGAHCRGGRCQCAATQKRCGARCVAASICCTDGHTGCVSSETCDQGTCRAGGGNCTPDCTNKQCGGDGCGGSCGQCGTGDTCSGGSCVACTLLTACPAGACGAVPDGCGGTLSCGGCTAGQCLTCGPNNTCVSTCGPCQTCGQFGCINRCSDNSGRFPGCVCPTGRCGAVDGICQTSGGSGRSCFIAGTRIAMADGTSTPIEFVTPGDRVLGRDGRVSRVVAIERPALGSRALYALNGSPFFVTAEHPFLTEGGWKAIDPAATAAENPRFDVGRLVIGDQLLALAGVLTPVGARGPVADDHLNIRQEAIPLTRLDSRRADPATPLYNLMLDGDHTYFADDLLVHNKFY